MALLDGRFEDAEGIALEVLAHTDPASATSLNASAQIAAAWYWSGRDDELLSVLKAFPTDQLPQRILVDLVRASTRARGGERDVAFDDLAAGGFGAIPWGWYRPGCLCHASAAAAWLGDIDAARALEPMLAPYAGQLLTAPTASLAFESADSVRGMLLMTLGRVDEAVESFEAAAALCDRASDAPHGVMNAHRLAGALLARDKPDDRDRARRLATDTLAGAEELGMAPDARFAQAVLDDVSRT